MKIYLDVDDVVLAWHDAYFKKYNLSGITDWIPYDTIKYHLKELQNDRMFWITLPLMHKPNFQPSGYISAREVPIQWTKDAMKLRKIPGRSKVKHVNWGESKIKVLKSLDCEIFIDDKYSTFKECHDNGIFCLLMNSSLNQHHETEYRIFDLDIKKIKKKYQKWLKSQ